MMEDELVKEYCPECKKEMCKEREHLYYCRDCNISRHIIAEW